MPKKRRGRPPGSKNKAKFGGSAAKMDVAQLSSYIASLRNTLGAKVEQQREYFERHASVSWADVASRPPLFTGSRSEIDEAIRASDRDWAGEGPA